MLAIWFVILIAVVGLGSLAAVVFGLVYAIANKKPAVAVGSLFLPVAVVIGLGLMGMMVFSARQGHIGGRGPIQVSWSSVPPVPAVPAVPAMPVMIHGPQDPPAFLAFGPVLLVALLAGSFCFAVFGKRRNCSGESGARRLGWGKAILLGVIAIVLLKYTTFTVWRGAQQPSGWISSHAEQVAQAQQSQRQLEELRRIADAAADQAAAAQLEGKNFQEMLEQVTKPRIELGTDGAKLTIDAESKPNPTVAAEAGSTRVVVPISAETQESLARTAARLEQMADRVAVMADQLSDTGTLLGKAMVALNERIDSRPKGVAAPPQAPAALEIPAPVLPASITTTTAPLPAPVKVHVAPHPGENTIIVKFDRHLLDQSGLTFEQVKEQLSRERMWNGKVVRFDENKLQITARGGFGDHYLPRLKNTIVGNNPNALFGGELHLSDLADVEVDGEMLAAAPVKTADRPSWIDEQPKNVGEVRRDIVVTEEYSSRAECERAADVLLLLKTYEHLSQLLGNPRSEEPPPSIALYTESGEIKADGQTIYQRHGSYGEWHDYRWKMLADMGIGIDFVRREIVVPQDGEYLETVDRSAGPMHKLYTRVEFRPNVDQQLLRRWEELRRGERFAVVGAGAGSVLGLLGIVFGLLKADTATKGYYTKRLFLGVPTAIMGGILAVLAWKEVIF